LETDWNRLVRQHGPGLFRAAWRILGHEADCEDVVQSVFLEAHQLWRERPADDWVRMLRLMATRRALDRLRLRGPIVSIEQFDSIAAADNPVADAIGRELGERLGQALVELAPREAEVFCLRYFDELSYLEIAAQLSISVSAVSTALNKARSRLEVLLHEASTGE
jgi:RNA polymerase sigma-70 factor (ECF subfamily)